MIHYHGIDLNPANERYKLRGKHFCVSYAYPSPSKFALQYGQSVMWDNGAFSIHTRGEAVNWNNFYKWVEDKLSPVHWAVCPDIIGGLPSENYALAKSYPLNKNQAAVVWHLHEPLDQIGRLMDLGFGKLCFGSSGDYWQVGSERWEARVDSAWNWIVKRGPIPWVHMLRGLSLCGDRWPFASADSNNVAVNFKRNGISPDRMAQNIDAVQSPITWTIKEQQSDFFGGAL